MFYSKCKYKIDTQMMMFYVLRENKNKKPNDNLK